MMCGAPVLIRGVQLQHVGGHTCDVRRGIAGWKSVSCHVARFDAATELPSGFSLGALRAASPHGVMNPSHTLNQETRVKVIQVSRLIASSKISHLTKPDSHLASECPSSSDRSINAVARHPCPQKNRVSLFPFTRGSITHDVRETPVGSPRSANQDVRKNTSHQTSATFNQNDATLFGRVTSAVLNLRPKRRSVT